MSISSADRFKKNHPCPICGGFDGQGRGQGKRCFGFLAPDGSYAHCSREDYSGGLPIEPAGTYAHRMDGSCKCGTVHGSDLPPRARPRLVNGSANGHPKGERVAEYTYVDIMGRPLHRTVRYKPKSFSQEHWNGSEWRPGLGEVARVIYRLPEVAAWPVEEPIFFVEGEKDVETAVKLGVCATTSPMGAKAWRAEYAEFLVGKWVATIADSDDVGREFIEKASAAFWRKASRTSRVDLGAKDLTEWVEAGGTKSDLLRLAVNAPLWAPPSSMKFIDAVDLLDKVFPAPKWAVETLIGDGMTLLVAAPKMGKSYLALNIAVAVVSGGRALGSLAVNAGDVLYLALEGGERLIQSRLRQMLDGSPLPRGLQIVTSWPRLDQGGLEALDDEIQKRPDLRMIVVDTLKRIRSEGRQGANMYDADVDALTPLQKLTEGRVSLVAVHHTNKRQLTDDPLDLVSGSAGIAATAAATLILRRTRGKSDAKLFVSGWSVEERDLACRFDKTLGLWILEGEADAVELSETRAAILEFLELHGKARPRQIADAIGKSASNVSVLLYKMVRAGQVKSIGDGLYTTR